MSDLFEDGCARSFGHRCGECRMGLGRHDINDPYCDLYREPIDD